MASFERLRMFRKLTHAECANHVGSESLEESGDTLLLPRSQQYGQNDVLLLLDRLCLRRVVLGLGCPRRCALNLGLDTVKTPVIQSFSFA